ncbi:MAG TPA: DUF805 domain-containing protein [Sphingomonadaceae bacterium]|jgi:uncharacterized membrane protein YhaH (DUF805 family)|nr:DUF805 domain-containing protein [Sphingomonadaceae bacterium]
MTTSWQHLYLDLNGRTSRRDFWIGFAGLVGAGVVANLLPVAGGVVSLALLYPAAALMTKRLHDFGRPGWLVMVPLAPAAPSILMAVFASMTIGNAATMGAGLAVAGFVALLSTLAMLVGLAFLLWVGTRDGDVAANGYGQPVLSAPLAQ